MMKRLFSVLVTLALLAAVGGSQAMAQEDVVKKHWKLGVKSLGGGDKAGALSHFQQAVKAGQSAQPPLAANSPVMIDAHYGVAYALMVDGKIMAAIPVAENLVVQAPESAEARYLLGVMLVRSATAANIKRGLEVLSFMAKESSGEIAVIASRAAGRLALNYSSTLYAGGKAKEANSAMATALEGVGNAPGGSPEENYNIRYASGLNLLASGNTDGAIFELGWLAAKQKDFALKNGVPIKRVLASAYYQAALDSLAKGKEGADFALDMLEELAKIEGENMADAHHARAQAYELKGDPATAKVHYDAILGIDPAYHKRVAPKAP